jgi:hypothetical protein
MLLRGDGRQQQQTTQEQQQDAGGLHGFDFTWNRDSAISRERDYHDATLGEVFEKGGADLVEISRGVVDALAGFLYTVKS